VGSNITIQTKLVLRLAVQLKYLFMMKLFTKKSLLGVRGGKGKTTNLPKTASTQQNVVDKMINSALSPLLKRPFEMDVRPECVCR
jgi:hypothetical protein